MTDLEISKALALAIGWPCVDIECDSDETGTFTWVEVWSPLDRPWRVFDYRDWNVIGPIAEKYDCFPFLFQERDEPLMWHTFDTNTGNQSQADTPQKAIALAVVNGAKK